MKRLRSPEEEDGNESRNDETTQDIIPALPDKLHELRIEYTTLLLQKQDEKAIEYLKNKINVANISFHWGSFLAKAVLEKRYIVVDYILSRPETTLENGWGVHTLEQAVCNNDFFVTDKILKRFPEKRYASTALKLSIMGGKTDLSLFLVGSHNATLHDSLLVKGRYFTKVCKDMDIKTIKLVLNLGADTFELDEWNRYGVHYFCPCYWKPQTSYFASEPCYRGLNNNVDIQMSTASTIREAHALVVQKMNEQLFEVMEEIAKAKGGSGMIKELNMLCIDYVGVDFDQNFGMNNSDITNNVAEI